MRIPFFHPLPAWMSYAIETLRARDRSWRVTTLLRTAGGTEYRVFRIEWKGWLRNARSRVA